MSFNINEVTIGQLKEISCLISKQDYQENPYWKIGEKYFIRTVTMHLIGELIFISNTEIVLKNASWVADSGRFHDALKTGELNEVEPFIDNVIINRESLVDATKWNHKLPDKQK